MEWLRWYIGCSTDPKFRVVAKKTGHPVASVLAVWAMLLERAGTSEDRGSISGFDCESADAALDLDDGSACAILDTLTEKGLIVSGAVAKWQERQPIRERIEDSSTERVKAYREKKKLELCNASETPCNASETPCNAMKRHETPRLDKIREEKSNINTPPLPPAGGRGSVSGFEDFWNAYPKKTGKKAAEKAWIKARDRPDTPEVLDALEQQKCSAQWRKDGGQFIPNPATWINQGRWQDELENGVRNNSPWAGAI